MKKWLLLILCLSAPLYGEHLVSRNAGNLTTGTLPNGRLDASSVTLQGNGILLSALVASTTTLQLQPNNTNYAQVGSVVNSTVTRILSYGGSIILSTQTVCGLAGTCFNTGVSTLNVVDIQATFVQGSTVAWTRIQLVESSGGVNGLPMLPNRFPPLDITTASALGQSAWTSPITTGVVIPAGWTLGVQISTVSAVGVLPTKMDIFLNIWKKPYGATN